METSKLTSKYQTTIPEEIRKFLKLGKGDRVRFEISGGEVLLRKEEWDDMLEDMALMRLSEKTMGEWRSSEDDDLLPPWKPKKKS